MEVWKIQILMQRGSLCLICRHAHFDVVLPLQTFVPKKRTLVAGRQTVGSDKVSLLTGLLVVTSHFLPDTEVSANKMKAGETNSLVASRSVQTLSLVEMFCKIICLPFHFLR
jgi:hypothetical protein